MVFASSVHIATNTSSVCVQNIDLGVCYNSSHTNRQGSHSQAVLLFSFWLLTARKHPKAKGEGLGAFITLMMSVFTEEGGGEDCQMIEQFWGLFLQCQFNLWRSPKRLWRGKNCYLLRGWRTCFFIQGLLPPPFGLHWYYSSNRKLKWWEGSGPKATQPRESCMLLKGIQWMWLVKSFINFLYTN